MSTSTIVKVTVDTPCTMTVESVSETAGNFGPQLRFDGVDGNGAISVFEKLERADEQLRRAGLDRSTVIGKTITLHKENVTSNGKTFPALRISVVGGAAGKPSNGSSKQPVSLGRPIAGIDDEPVVREETGAPPKADGGDKIASQFATYSRCLDQAHKEAIRIGLDKFGGDIAGAIIASAATLYIQANR